MKKLTYKIDSDNLVRDLIELGFIQVEKGIFIHRFAGFKWHTYTTITCKFTAFIDEKELRIDVFTESGDAYVPFYKNDINNHVLSIVQSNIEKELKNCNKILNFEE